MSSSSPSAPTHLETQTSSSTSSPSPPEHGGRRQCMPSPPTSMPPLPSSSAAARISCGGSICSSFTLPTTFIRSWSTLSSSRSFVMVRHSPLPIPVPTEQLALGNQKDLCITTRAASTGFDFVSGCFFQMGGSIAASNATLVRAEA